MWLQWNNRSFRDNSRLAPRSRVTTTFFVLSLSLVVVFISDVLAENDLSCLCDGAVPCAARNLTEAKCTSGRLLPRKDCSCCLVCAKQLSDPCNDVELPCDTDFGLVCSVGENRKCQPETSCVDDTECSNDRFCFGGACADPCKVLSDVCAESGPTNGICSVRSHRALCACPTGQAVAEGTRVCADAGASSGISKEKEQEKPATLCHLEDGGVKPEGCKNGTGHNVTASSHGHAQARNFKFEDSDDQNNLRREDEDDSNAHTHKNGEIEDESTESVTSPSVELHEDDENGHAHDTVQEDEHGVQLLTSDVPQMSHEEESEMMKISIVKTTATSASIKLPVHDKTAILSIALSSSVAEPQTAHDEDHVWKDHMIPPGLGMLTLSDLAPNHSYTVKYTVGHKTYPEVQFSTPSDVPLVNNGPDEAQGEIEKQSAHEQLKSTEDEISEKELPQDGDEPTTNIPEAIKETTTTEKTPEAVSTTTTEAVRQPSSSEPTISVQTELQPNTSEVTPATGCLFNNSLYQVGAVVFEGCDTRCECLADGEMKCMERCSIPFFKNGTFAADPLCFEEPSGDDECCVIVACARSSHAGMARELSLNPCDMVKCGPNADCRYEVSPAGMQSESPNEDTLCVCKENFSGDAYDKVKGCQMVPTSTHVSAPVLNSTFTAVSAHEKKVEGCSSNNKTFSYGEEYLDGCSYKCHCEVSGEFLCLPRCSYRHDEEQKIPAGCHIEKDASDPECCETLVCEGEVKKEKARVSTDGCLYKNRSYEKEEKFFDGCEQQCMCFLNGDVTCQPRCPPMGPVLLDKDCITLQDPTDPCCNVTVCGNHTVSDVMKQAIELERKRLQNAASSTERTARLDDIDDSRFRGTTTTAQTQIQHLTLKITTVMPINESAVFVSIKVAEDHLSEILKLPIHIFYSLNESAPTDSWSKMVTLRVQDLFVEGSDELHTIVSGLDPGKLYFFQVEVNGIRSDVGSGKTKAQDKNEVHEYEEESSEEARDDFGPTSGEAVCTYKNKTFSAGEEFYDGCEEYCVCEDAGSVSCSPLECPTDFGLDLIDPNCVKWEPVEPEGERIPPNCCSQMKCVQNSSCSFLGRTFRNFEEIPETLSGCEKRCYCEYGNVTCQSACPRLSETPPKNLQCPPGVAKVMPLHYNECCMGWVCPVQNKTHGSVPLLPNAPPSHHPVVTNHSVPPKLAPPNAPPGFHIPPPLTHLLHHGLLYGDDEENEDLLVPPSTGNEPSIIGLDRLQAHQLQELLHRLSAENEGHPNRPGQGQGQGHRRPGLHVSSKVTAEIRELERQGARVVGHAPDGSVILFVPEDGAEAPPPPPFPPSPPRPNFPHAMLPAPNQFPFGGTNLQETETGMAHDEITGVIIRALNESTLHIDFTVSPVLVGLQGAVEVSYTNEFGKKPDPTQWEKQLFQQPEDVIDNSHLQLFLNGLKPNSEYHLQIQVIISSIHNSPVSDIFVIRTPPAALPPIVKIDPELKVLETTSRTLEVSWRKFTDFESSLIDGVQVKYKAYDDQIYVTSELIHRSLNSYKLTNLQPGKKYEVSLLLVPFTNQTTELQSESGIHVETPPEVDDFSFSVSVEAGKIGETTAELIWEGVPFPEDKFVNIFQVLYQSDNQKEQKSYFKVADRETTKRAVLQDLKPGTRYRVWLEAFLTNGKKKRSNVIYVLTKVGSGSLPSPEKSEQESNLLNAGAPGPAQPATSYYGALVALAIVATFSVIGIIALLMILIKKQSQSKLPINDRKSESSYDNPSFKNYDMEANGHSNKSSEL